MSKLFVNPRESAAPPTQAAALAALSAADLPIPARLVVAWIALAHGGAVRCYQAELAAAVGIDEKTLRRVLPTLRSRGLLVVRADGKPRDPKSYSLPGCWG